MSIRSLAIAIGGAASLAVQARSEDPDCTRYIPEIGRTVRVPCSDGALQPPPASSLPSAEARDDRSDKMRLGLTLSALTPALRDAFKVATNIDGVLVRDVDLRSEAARRGIRRGDVILQTNQGAVSAPADVLRNIDAAAATGRKAILLLIQHGGGQATFVALPIE
jgi:S1-C subfamily serine protease